MAFQYLKFTFNVMLKLSRSDAEIRKDERETKSLSNSFLPSPELNISLKTSRHTSFLRPQGPTNFFCRGPGNPQIVQTLWIMWSLCNYLTSVLS